MSLLFISNAGYPAASICLLIFACISSGSISSGSSTSNSTLGSGSFSHTRINSSTEETYPAFAQSSMHCCSSHMPFTFLRKQIFPPAPPRFVKFNFLASAETFGDASRTPPSDQVPELINAQSSPLVGIAAIAEAVSWHAGTISSVSSNAGISFNSCRIFPTIVPVGTIAGAAARQSPVAAKISSHHSSVSSETSCVCVAFVYSETGSPPSRCVMYSGKFSHGERGSIPPPTSACN